MQSRGSLRSLVMLVCCTALWSNARGQEPAPTPPTTGVPENKPGAPRTPPVPASAAPGANPPAPEGRDGEPPRRPPGVVGAIGGVLPIPLPGGADPDPPPGAPSRRGRPRPGSIFDPGASGPGISQREGNFLDGALNPRTGWPFVLLDHFAPRPDRVARLWVVSTRDCPQTMGTDPWGSLKVQHFDGRGDLVDIDPAALFAQVSGNPVLIQVQGSLTTADVALGGLLWTHSWLEESHAILPQTVVIAFDWPSQRIYRNDVRDINEKGRRAYVAAYHLARFVQAFPAESRVCLLGQSYGGRVVPSALHLLGGGSLNSQDHDAPVCLPAVRPDRHVRAVVLAGASDHDWLNPGARLDRALAGCEAFLNLYNRRDEALRYYSLLIRSGHHHALGRLGLTNRDLEKLGPAAMRYSEHDIHELLGREHSLLDAVANRQIARWIAPYVWAPVPPPSPARTEAEPPETTIRSRRAFSRFRGTAN